LAERYPELYQSGLSQLADKGYYVKKVFKAFYLLFDGKSFIPINKKNSKETPIEIPTCVKELKMKYHSSWYEEKQDRFRVKFICPEPNEDCEKHRNNKACYKYLQTREPYPGEVQQLSANFKKHTH